jgi:beta-aspartyl-peptidase (threonine type)
MTAIIVHGGARPISPEKAEANRRGCLAALRAGWSVLEAGGGALDVVEAAIRTLEADPLFNAGFGSTLNPDGVVRMDAGLMEGRTLEAGAVAVIEGVRHPISVAREVLEAPEVLIVAEHARRFAEEHGAELCDREDMISDEQRRKWEEQHAKDAQLVGTNDTVGCVALDAEGNLAAGASTGGTGDKTPGRVGDSPLVGCGFYAENGVGGCSLTGEGETILRLALARTALDFLRSGDAPEPAAQRAMDLLMERTEGKGGIILLDEEGRPGWAHNEDNMAVAYRTSAMSAPRAFVHKDEERRPDNVGS